MLILENERINMILSENYSEIDVWKNKYLSSQKNDNLKILEEKVIYLKNQNKVLKIELETKKDEELEDFKNVEKKINVLISENERLKDSLNEKKTEVDFFRQKFIEAQKSIENV